MFVLFSISVRFYSSIYFIRFSMNIYPLVFHTPKSLPSCDVLDLSVFHPRSVADTVGWWAQVDSNHRPRAYQARALTSWAMSPYGDDGIRTHDPLLAGQVLSQLSYTPILLGFLLLSSLLVTQNWTTSEAYSHLYLTWPLVCRDFALLKTTKSRKPRSQISCSP